MAKELSRGASTPSKLQVPQSLAKINEKKSRRRGLKSASVVPAGRFKRSTVSANVGSAVQLYGMKSMQSGQFLSDMTTEPG